MRFLLSLFLLAHALGGVLEVSALELQSDSHTHEQSSVAADLFLISVDPEEIYAALSSALKKDPRHVYPLLLMVRDSAQSGLHFHGTLSRATVPKELTVAQASKMIAFAYDEQGNYRGLKEFDERFRAFLLQTGLHLKEIAIVHVHLVQDERDEARVALMTTQNEGSCRLDSKDSLEELLATNPSSVFSFETLQKEEAPDVEALTGIQ